MNFSAKRTGLLIAAVALSGTLVTSAWANRALPPEPKPKPANTQYPIAIKPLAKAQGQSQIVIPQSLIRQINKNAADFKRADAGFKPSSTVVSGLALSMSLCFGGLWFLRKRHGVSGRHAHGLLLAAAIVPAGLWMGSTALANVAARPIEKQPEPAKPTHVRVVIGEGRSIELRLSENDFKQLATSYMIEQLQQQREEQPATGKSKR